MQEQEKPKIRCIDFPEELFGWIKIKAKESIRSFKGEVVYQLLKAKELENQSNQESQQ